MVTGSACFPASASSLNVRAERLQAESHSIAMCDDAVTLTPNATILGLLDTLTVSGIDPSCNGTTLRIAIRTILGVTLQTSVPVSGITAGSTSLVLDLTSLNLLLANLGTTYFAFEPAS